MLSSAYKIGEFSNILSEVLKKYNFQNLNDLFPCNTTTEFMCRVIHSDLENKLQAKAFCGHCTGKLFESHKAWAKYSKYIEAKSS